MTIKSHIQFHEIKSKIEKKRKKERVINCVHDHEARVAVTKQGKERSERQTWPRRSRGRLVEEDC